MGTENGKKVWKYKFVQELISLRRSTNLLPSYFRPSDFQKFKEHRQQQQGPSFTDPSLPVPAEAQIEKTGNKSQDEDDMQIDNDEDLPEHFTRELGGKWVGFWFAWWDPQ